MNQEHLRRALLAGLPTIIFDEDDSGEPPDGYSTFSVRVEPIPTGVCLSIQIGTDLPHEWEFTSEMEATAFLGLLVAGAASH